MKTLIGLILLLTASTALALPFEIPCRGTTRRVGAIVDFATRCLDRNYQHPKLGGRENAAITIRKNSLMLRGVAAIGTMTFVYPEGNTTCLVKDSIVSQ